MTPHEYLGASERTEKKFPEGMTLSSDQQVILSYLSDDIETLGEALDHMKKHLIYGAKCELQPPQTEFSRRSVELSEEQASLLHAALGLLTEAVEFYAPVINHVLKGGELDKVNLFEELFDSTWYTAIPLRLFGETFENGFDTNIAKLKARFPEKFTEEDATVRNLDTERTILEAGHA